MVMDSLNFNKMEYQPNILVVSGGGPKGMAFIGALSSLEEKTTFDINKIKILSGSSIGGVICTAICFGYSLQEMKNWFSSVDFSNLCPALYQYNYDKKILPLLYKSYSLSSGDEIKEILTRTFIFKNINVEITFKELYDKTGKLLILTGSNLSNKNCDYFSYKTTPTMKVFTALEITTRIPYVFPHIKYNQQIYVDGHLFDPFPIKGCGKKNLKENKGKILGIISQPNKKETEIKNIKDFTFSIIEGLSYQYMKKTIGKYKKYIIPIELETGFFDLKSNPDKMLNFFNIGKETGYLFINKI